jgi:predicted GNAT family acetyltransferase
MSLYADYVRERTTDSVLETEFGFAVYRYLNEKQVYIVDIYIKPDLRKAGKARVIADLICKEAKNKGCVDVIGTVVPSMKNSTESIKVLLGYGMRLEASSNDLIMFKKEI